MNFSESADALYEPPHPRPLPALPALARTAWQGENNLLSLLPRPAYRFDVGHLGWSRRGTLLVNQPELMKSVMTDPADIFPKNDLMVGALEHLVGDSIFVSSGEVWRRQRAMIDPAFSHIQLSRAFSSMRDAVDDYEAVLARHAADERPFSIDLAMSHLTADIICRTVFSTSLASGIAKDVFEDFTIFERSVAHISLKALIFDRPFKSYEQSPEVSAACERIRRHLGSLVDSHLEDTNGHYHDIASACIAARDAQSGCPFNRKELIDQLGVLFLAGHETTASTLTWLFFILAMHPETVRRIRTEVDSVVGDREVGFEHVRDLKFVRAVFRETLRLYPPITFIPRVALEATQIGKFRVRRGAMIMISPWTTHRNKNFWPNPDKFDPDRFMPAREGELVAGTFLPFGMGPRTCIGVGFAHQEACLIVARLTRRFDFSLVPGQTIRPVARLTTRPQHQIMLKASAREGA